MTSSVTESPYFNPVYEYAIARSIGAYMPYVFEPMTYLAILTTVANTEIAISSSNAVGGTP